MTGEIEVHDAGGGGQQGGARTDDPLETRTTERGFDWHRAVPSEYGGGVQVSESSNAEYPGVWLRAAAPVNLNDRDGDHHEVPINLHARNAWLLARQLAALVVQHYHGDARPDAALDDARRAVAEITGWGPSVAETLLRRLAHRGFVLVDVNAPVETPRELEPAATVSFAAGEDVHEEPDNGEMVGLYHGGVIDSVWMRDNHTAKEAGFDPAERWFRVGAEYADDDEDPKTWREMRSSASGSLSKLVRLHHAATNPPGVTVRREWGVWSADGTVYAVDPPTEDKAVAEATGLYRGDGDEPGEAGCAPASRYVMVLPKDGTGLPNEVASGWRRAATWAPPPEKLTEPE